MFLTFGLCMTVIMLAVEKNKSTPLAPLAIGFALFSTQVRIYGFCTYVRCLYIFDSLPESISPGRRSTQVYTCTFSLLQYPICRKRLMFISLYSPCLWICSCHRRFCRISLDLREF